jgi:WD40 repeat protein
MKTSVQEQLECKLIMAQRSGRESMLALESPPVMDDNDAFTTTQQIKTQLVTCGEDGAIKCWDFQNQQLPCKHSGYEKIGPTSAMTSLGFRPNAVTVAADGRLYIWEGRTLIRFIHAAPINVILSMSYHGGGSSSGSKKGGGISGGIITGSSDGRVHMWDSSDNTRPGALYSTGTCLIVACVGLIDVWSLTCCTCFSFLFLCFHSRFRIVSTTCFFVELACCSRYHIDWYTRQ